MTPGARKGERNMKQTSGKKTSEITGAQRLRRPNWFQCGGVGTQPIVSSQQLFDNLAKDAGEGGEDESGIFSACRNRRGRES